MTERDRHSIPAEGETDWDEIGKVAEGAILSGASLPWEVVKGWLELWDARTR